MGTHSNAWILSYDGWSSDLATQKLLRFNLQRYQIPHEGMLVRTYFLNQNINQMWQMYSSRCFGLHLPDLLANMADGKGLFSNKREAMVSSLRQ